MSKVDPITLGVVWGGLRSIAEEMGAALKKTAYSLAVRKAEDFSVSLFDDTGRLIAQGDFSPGHLGSMPFVVKHVISEYPPEEMNPGDVIILNDSYLGSGHYPDCFCVAPIFHKNKLVAFAVNCAHHVDVGGGAPGSQAVENVNDVFQEGIRILPVKLVKCREIQNDILKLIIGNVRVPDVVKGDLMAQANANRMGEKRLSSLIETYGLNVIKKCMDEIISRSEEAIRSAIEKIPDGSYVFTDYFDDSGRDTPPIKVHVTATVNGSDITIDFSGSSPQTRSALNSVLNYTYAYCFFAVKCLTDPYIPQNEGCVRPIKVVAPEGSFFNPRFPTAVGGRAIVNQRLFEVVMGALSQAIPNKVITAASHWANPNFGGFNSRTGKQFVCYEIVVGGFGARSDRDGCEAMVSAFNISNIPVEVLETNYPLRIERFEIVRDSAGSGQFRGGCAIRRDVRVLEDHIQFSNLTDRHLYPPFGLFEGEPGSTGITILNPGPNEQVLHSKGCYELKSGDLVSQTLAGAGGYGDPLKRDIEAVRLDVTGEYVSVEAAREKYGVVVDPTTKEVDIKETLNHRNRKSEPIRS